MSLDRDPHGWATGQAAEFRAGNFFHGVDQHRQPQLLAVSRSPWLNLLVHRLSLTKPASASPAVTNPEIANRFPTNMPPSTP
jgi:hypothetical protein